MNSDLLRQHLTWMWAKAYLFALAEGAPILIIPRDHPVMNYNRIRQATHRTDHATHGYHYQLTLF